MNILGWIYTILVWGYTIFAFSTHALITRVFRRFYKDPEGYCIRMTAPFFWGAFKLFGFKLTIEGQENIPDHPFIVVSNHQSHMDIVVLLFGLRRKTAFIAKEELMKVPVLGWDIKAQGHIAINRFDPRAAVTELKRVEKLMEGGKSFILFPEGTRSLTGEVGPFKKGAFMMAANTGTQLLPCSISGTWNILNKTSLKMHPGAIHLRIGKPIKVVKPSDSQQVKKLAEELLVQCREEIVAHVVVRG